MYMKGLIIYASNTGNVAKFVDKLKDKLDGDYEAVNIKDTNPKDIKLKQYDKVVIGTYMRRQKADPDISDFTIRNLDALLEKNVYIFVSALETEDGYKREIMLSFPEKIRDAFEIYNVGGSFEYYELRYIERVMIRKIADKQGKTVEDLKNYNEKRLDKFAEIVNNTEPLKKLEAEREKIS
ncbi:hypothetical protein GF389_03825 [Candidatus Dojkabacteria bacterium]|nr:hypothetical protein [Candidatus Dojkabacteria bacterium]